MCTAVTLGCRTAFLFFCMVAKGFLTIGNSSKSKVDDAVDMPDRPVLLVVAAGSESAPDDVELLAVSDTPRLGGAVELLEPSISSTTAGLSPWADALIRLLSGSAEPTARPSDTITLRFPPRVDSFESFRYV
jgi:hypothetical protein